MRFSKDCGHIWVERLIKRLASQQWTERKGRGEEKELTGKERKEKERNRKDRMEESRRELSTPQQSENHHVSDLWQL